MPASSASPRSSRIFLPFLLFNCLIFLSGHLNLQAQFRSKGDIDSLRIHLLGKYNNLSFGLYIDTYYNMTLGSGKDTSNIVPFSANCPVADQIRMNVAALEFAYSAEKIRGKLAIQYGDAPNLLASPNAQFIKTLRQANFGFRITRKLWIDAGYMMNPVGYESTWAVMNRISFVTLGGYFEPGSILGAKLSYQINDRWDGGIIIGNPYSLAYGQNTHISGQIFLNYHPRQNLLIAYSNFFGNQALADAELDNDILYNNLIIKWYPFTSLELVGQVDLAAQTNSTLPPDTNRVAGMYSGFLQARYQLAEKYSLTGRLEWLDDPNGFLTGVNIPTRRGLSTQGFAFSFEYKPVPFGYVRIAYRFLQGYPGSRIFSSNTSDRLQALIFSTGVRF